MPQRQINRIRTWATVVESWRTTAMAAAWKPARPKDSLFKGALHRSTAVQVIMPIRGTGNPVLLSEGAGWQDFQQYDEDERHESEDRIFGLPPIQ